MGFDDCIFCCFLILVITSFVTLKSVTSRNHERLFVILKIHIPSSTELGKLRFERPSEKILDLSIAELYKWNFKVSRQMDGESVKLSRR